MLSNSINQRAIEDNMAHSYVCVPCNMLVLSFKALAACNLNRYIVTCVQHNVESKCITENSVISTISYLMTVSASHYIMCDDTIVNSSTLNLNPYRLPPLA